MQLFALGEQIQSLLKIQRLAVGHQYHPVRLAKGRFGLGQPKRGDQSLERGGLGRHRARPVDAQQSLATRAQGARPDADSAEVSNRM